jgi:hypothetical protein
LIRSQTFLRKKGIEIERSKSGSRNITIRWIGRKEIELREEVQPQPAFQPESQEGLKEVSAEECERFDFPVMPAIIEEHGPAMEPSPSIEWDTGKLKKPLSAKDEDIVEGEI